MGDSVKKFLIQLFLKSDTKGGDETEKSLERIADKAKKVGDVGQKMSLFLTAPLAALGALAIRTTATFEQSMARVAAVSGATASQFKMLENQAQMLGATTRYSASQAAEAMSFLSMAGFKAEQTYAAMPSTLQLAASAMIDIGRAADITSNILTGMGKDVSELAHVNDVLVAAMTNSNTDLNQLGDAMKYVAPVAKGAGQSLEDVVAAIGALGNAGIQGSMAGTSMRATLAALQSPSTAAQKIFKELGVSIRDSSGAMRPMLDVIEELRVAGINGAQIFDIFGDRAASAVMALIEQGGDSIKKFSKALEDSAGTAARVAEVQERTLLGAWEQIKSAWEALQMSLAKVGAFQMISDMAKSVAKLLEAFDKLSAGTKTWLVALAATLAVLPPVIVAISKLVGGIASLTLGFKTCIAWSNSASLALIKTGASATTARYALYALRTAMATLPIGLIIGLVTMFASSFASASEKIEATTPVVHKSKKSFDELAKSIGKTSEEINKMVGAFGKNPLSAEWLQTATAAKKSLIEQKAAIDAEEKYIAKIQKRYDEITSYNVIYRANFTNEILSLEHQIRARSSALDLEKKSYTLGALHLQAEVKARNAAVLQNNKDLEELRVSENRLGNTRNTQLRSNLSIQKNYNEALKDSETIASAIAELESKRKDESLSVKARVLATNELNSKIQEQISNDAKLLDLKNKLSEAEKKSFDERKKAFSASLPARELAILRATADGEVALAEHLREQMNVKKEFFALKESGIKDDKTAIEMAKEKVALNKQIADNKLVEERESLKLQAQIKGLLASGKKTEADALQIRKQAFDYADRFKTSYEDALKSIREINKLQQGDKAQTDSKDVKFGNLSAIEREQSKINKMLESKNASTVANARKRESSFEDKYGIGIDTNVNEFKGISRKTGKPIDAQVGKYAREKENISDASYAMAAHSSSALRAKKPTPPSPSKRSGSKDEEATDNAGGDIVSTVQTGVESLGQIGELIKQLCDAVKKLESNTKGSISRLSRR